LAGRGPELDHPTGLRGDESLILAPKQIVDGDRVTVSGGGN